MSVYRLAFLIYSARFQAKASLLLLASFVSACSTQTYQPAPIDIEKSSHSYLNQSLKSDTLANFLSLQNTTAPQANAAWKLDALINSALFFHPSLQQVKASHRLAEQQLAQGKLKPTPSISTQIARSNRANGDIDPFALSLSIDLPIQTNDKQAIRIEKLSHLTEIAKLDVASTAWLIRQGVISVAHEYFQQHQEQALIEREVAIQEKIVRLLQSRVKYGESGKLPLQQAQTSLAQAQQQLQTSKHRLSAIRAHLAKQIGVSAGETTDLRINTDPFSYALKQNIEALSEQTLKRDALLNHLAIRKALLQYAIAEQSLKLEYAKQIPDITLSPGYAFEFGDSVWSLGFNSLMTLLNKNKVGIEQAQLLREVEVANFNVTQHQVLSDIEFAVTQLHSASVALEANKALIQTHLDQYENLQKQFNSGLIGRLDLVIGELSLAQTQRSKLALEKAFLLAFLQVENISQTPILTQTVFENHAEPQHTSQP